MRATKISMEDMQVGDEIIIAASDGGSIHCEIRELQQVDEVVEGHIGRYFSILHDSPSAFFFVSDTDEIYLIHRIREH